jgi:hypothetical protein
MSSDKSCSTVLIYTIHRTEPWFAYIGKLMEFDNSVTVSCLPGEGDLNVISDFQAAQERFYAQNARHSNLLDAPLVEDIIARCRVLRFMGERRAAAMALAMAEAFDKVLDETHPTVVFSFPIDRYVSHVLEHLAKERGIEFFELTVSAIPGMSMLLKKGVLCQRDEIPDPDLVDHYVDELATPLYTPSYVKGAANFTQARFLRVFLYFRLRGFVFWLLSLWNEDKYNLHYLDAQSFLGHKPRLSDRNVTKLVEYDWQKKIEIVPRNKRIFIGLQLFPEASIDYWINNRDLIDYENLLVEIAQTFADAGYVVVVKDHPLQFGFRQIDLIKRLQKISSLVFLPYEVSGTYVLQRCGVNFTTTGTLGLQAALLGVKSIVTENYYSTDDDFLILRDRAELAQLPEQAEAMLEVTDLQARQQRIIANLLRGSFEADFFSFEKFDLTAPSLGAFELGTILGKQLRLQMRRS